MKRTFALISFSCALLLCPARALEVTGYSPAVNDRFVSGYPKAPVMNGSPAFIGKGFDWSGVGWDPAEPTHSVTLISPRHFVHATHQGVGSVGKELHFVGRDGALRRYTIARLQKVPLPPDASGKTKDSDLSLGTLARDIAPGDGVTFYPVAFLGADFSKYLKQRLFVYGHTARIGLNEVVDGFIAPGEKAELKFLKVAVTGMAKTESGDSGSPTFLARGGKLALVGTHTEVCVDTFVPALIAPLNTLMAVDGKTVTVQE